MIPDSELDRIKAYCDAYEKDPCTWSDNGRDTDARDDLPRLVAAYRELRDAVAPILQELRNREPFEETNPDWNLDAVIDCSVTVGEARKLAEAMKGDAT